MADPIAVWGALTGTLGLAVAAQREYLARKTGLAVRPGVSMNSSRKEPVGQITEAWAMVNFWNTGGRALSAEHVGFRWFVADDLGGGVTGLNEVRAEIALNGPIELAVDGPSSKVHTPIGPLLRAGVNPMSPLEAFVITTGDREWFSPMQPLVRSTSPNRSLAELGQDLERLSQEAEPPPAVFPELVSLLREEPFLPPDD